MSPDGTPYARFFDLPDHPLEGSDVVVLPLPYEDTVCYGPGTAGGPAAVWGASRHVELWDEETGFDLAGLRFHSAAAVAPLPDEGPGVYHDRLAEAARRFHTGGPLVLGIGGEHSLTPPLVTAARPDPGSLDDLTVVQFDAHADLRAEYEGTPHSHACAMHPLVDRGARLIAVGIRSAEREEAAWGIATGRVETWYEHDLEHPEREAALLERLRRLDGPAYLTIDMDGFEPSLCPGTGTPVPGGLGWRQTMRYLRALLLENVAAELVGVDVVETVPQAGTRVNEYTAARLVAKILAYRFAPPAS